MKQQSQNEKLNVLRASFLGYSMALFIQILIGGLILLHIISWWIGETGLILAILGLLIPPIGLLNAIFIFVRLI